MNKMDVIAFASICIVSAFYIYFFGEKKNTYRKKIRKEIDDAIKNLKEHDNNSNNRINTEK